MAKSKRRYRGDGAGCLAGMILGLPYWFCIDYAALWRLITGGAK